MNSFINNPDEEKICPFLGLPFDWQTAMDYPSQQNYCRRKRPACAPDEAHQREYCLNTSFRQCGLFAVENMTEQPARPVSKPSTSTGKIPPPVWLFLGLCIIPLTLWQILWRVPRVIAFFQEDLESPGPVHSTDEFSPIIRSVPTLKPVATSTQPTAPIIEISVVPTNTPAAPHLFETPIGSNGRYSLHRVSSGEDLLSIAERYHTSVDAIRATNYGMPQELWMDTVIIIPPDQTDLSGALPLTALQISSDGLTIHNLALQLGINPDELAALNNRPSDYLLSTGEWVIVPYSQPVP